MRSVSILIVGDEILRGEIADENGPYLIRTLGAAGVQAVRQVVVGDRQDEITGELGRLRALADAVVVSGGIGPTHDDVTRPAVALALGRTLVVHPEAERRIRGFYGAAVTAAELSMADLPQGARLVNGHKTGTFGFEVGGVYVLPGVPFLFRDLVEGIARDFAAPGLFRQEVHSQRREGELAPLLGALQERCRDLSIGSYPVCTEGRWSVRIVLRGEDRLRLEHAARELRRSMGEPE